MPQEWDSLPIRVENKALNGGIYIVKGVDAEGNSVVAKVLVK